MLQPANLGLLLLLVGTALLWGRYRRAGRLVMTATAACTVLVSVLPIADWLIRPLEDRFPTLTTLPDRVDGVVILGGAIDQFLTRSRGQIALNRTAERLTEAIVLTRRYRNARLVFSGGSGEIFDQSLKEADAARQFLHAMGADPARIELEDQSRNTHENAVLSHRFVDPRPGERWLLVTSALHMPRAMGAFRAVGWDITPYPVDYLTGVGRSSFAGGLQSGLGALAVATREWTALAAYRILGRTKTLFPRP